MREFYLAKRLLDDYADKTEPTKYPELFESLVKKSSYDQLQSELKAKDELLRECEKALEHYANKRISEGGTARAYFEKWKKDAKT